MSAHPTISDVALALASRQQITRSVSGYITTDNQKGAKRYKVDVTDPDPQYVLATLAVMDAEMSALCPAENGNGAA